MARCSRVEQIRDGELVEGDGALWMTWLVLEAGAPV